MYQCVSHCCSIFLVTVNSSSALSHFSASVSQNLNEEKCIVLTSYCSSGREEQIVFEALEDLTILCRGHWKLKSIRTSYYIMVKIDQTHVLMTNEWGSWHHDTLSCLCLSCWLYWLEILFWNIVYKNMITSLTKLYEVFMCLCHRILWCPAPRLPAPCLCTSWRWWRWWGSGWWWSMSI